MIFFLMFCNYYFINWNQNEGFGVFLLFFLFLLCFGNICVSAKTSHLSAFLAFLFLLGFGNICVSTMASHLSAFLVM